MKKMSPKALLLTGTLIFTSIAFAHNGQNAGEIKKQQVTIADGSKRNPSKTILENAANSKDHSILVALVKAADLSETLQNEGPYTVFAPTNDAFGKLPTGTVEILLKPENKKLLQRVLTYHVVKGNLTASDILAAIKAGNGKAAFETINGGSITAWRSGRTIHLMDENGNKSKITVADVNQSNGITHVVDAVITPKS